MSENALYADKAAIFKLLTTELKSYKRLVNPEKIYLDNTNLMYALGAKVNEGNLRETFFFNQLSHSHGVSATKTGDFLVDGKYTFEVGGPSKDSSIRKSAKMQFIFLRFLYMLHFGVEFYLYSADVSSVREPAEALFGWLIDKTKPASSRLYQRAIKLYPFGVIFRKNCYICTRTGLFSQTYSKFIPVRDYLCTSGNI